jgi:hypothetical protein
MKDNKKILSEISRIHEIMGVNNTLLNESIWDDLFKAGAKSSDEVITIGGKTAPDELAKAIRNASKQVDDGVTSVKNSIDDVLRVAKTVSPKLVDELIDKIVNHPKVADTFISMTDDAAKAIRHLVDQGKSLSEAIKQVKEVYGPLFRNSDTLPNEVYDRFLKEVTEEVGDYKPKVDGETPTPSGGSGGSGGSGDFSIPNIEKSLSEVVDEITIDEIAKIDTKLKKWWGPTLEKLKQLTIGNITTGKRLQNSIIKDIGLWTKVAPNVKPVIRKRIVAKLQNLEQVNKDLLESTNSWIDKEIRPQAVKDRDVKNFYDKIVARDGWARIKVLNNVFNGAKIGLKDVITNNKTLRQSWLKAVTKPFTIPVNILTRIANQLGKNKGWNLELIGKMTPEQWTAFKNWFATTNPAGLKAFKEVFNNQGVFGGMSYIAAQALYRYYLVSVMIGTVRTLGAIGLEGIDYVFDTELSDAAISNYLFGTENLNELAKGLRDAEGGEFSEYVSVIYDMISSQSEPFRNWIGMWPLAKTGEAIGVAIASVLDGTADDKIADLETELKQKEEEVKQALEDEGYTWPPSLDDTETTTDDEDSTPESSGEPGSLDDFRKQLGVELNQVSQDGDIYKWDLGGVIFNYKLVNGKYVKQD